VDGDDFRGDTARNYSIPPDNPFVGTAGEDEIWAYGLRNAWRCAFDSKLGDLYMGDVGQDSREEINFQPATSTGGENYGWSCFEGTECTTFGGCDCGSIGAVDPVTEYSHSDASPVCSVTGGEVYRGCAIPDLDGTYFFADFCSADIWSLRMKGGLATDIRDRTTELDPPGSANINGISSFGRDAAGELYVCDLFGGEVFKIVPSPMLLAAETFPPRGAIDARRHVAADGITPIGWNRVELTFNNALQCNPQDQFVISQDGGALAAPSIVSIDVSGSPVVEVTLKRPIEPLAWTVLFHAESQSAVRLGSLPGDINGNGTSDSHDILALVAALGGKTKALSSWSGDINRSGEQTAHDLLETIDLLNGAIGGEAFLGVSLP